MNTNRLENLTERHPAGRRVRRVGRTLVTTFWLSHVILLAGTVTTGMADEPDELPGERSDPASAAVVLPSHPVAIAAPIGSADPASLRSGLRRIEQSLSCPAKVGRYAARLLLRLDRDRNGLLEAGEWPPALGSFAAADTNADGHVSAAELAQWIWNRGRSHRLRPPPQPDETAPDGAAPGVGNGPRDRETPIPRGSSGAGNASPGGSAPDLRQGKRFYVADPRLPQGLPPWFIERDADGDGQLTLSEFSSGDVSGIPGGFESYDLNHDGILTAEEYMAAISSKPAATHAASVGTK